MLRRILPIAVGALLVGNAGALAAMPSGERHLAEVIPPGNRVVVSRTLDGARVLVVSSRRDLRLLVAYKQRDRWHSVRVDPAPAGSSAAWAATTGSGPVPAFSAVYGRAPGEKVVVRWADGKATPTVPVKGAYLAVRRGRIKPEGVDLNPAPAP
ncbi:MAG: hypothetical protein H0W70_01980 [Actinobacteria bacterium]|nr:hypothetical protein [Actinomycetota bacterium]